MTGAFKTSSLTRCDRPKQVLGLRQELAPTRRKVGYSQRTRVKKVTKRRLTRTKKETKVLTRKMKKMSRATTIFER